MKKKILGPAGGTWLSRNIIKSPVFYCLCMTQKQFDQEVKDMKVPAHQVPRFLGGDRANATSHFFTYKGETVVVVCLGDTKKRTRSEVCGLLIHEAVHIWQEVCEKMGEKEPSSEFMAYSIQWIAQQLIWAWNDGRGRRRNEACG